MQGCVLNMGGMTMTAVKFDLHGQTCPNVTLSTTNPTYTALVSKADPTHPVKITITK